MVIYNNDRIQCDHSAERSSACSNTVCVALSCKSGGYWRPPSSVRATIDNDNFYVLNSILVVQIKGDAKVSNFFVLGILNSKLCNFIYRNLTQEKGRTFAEVKPKNVRKLYIPNITLNKELHEEISKIVKARIALKCKTSDSNEAPILERKINSLIYNFYGLTPEEIAIVEEASRG